MLSALFIRRTAVFRGIAICASAMLAHTGWAQEPGAVSQAETETPAAKSDEIVVKGRRLPAAEAPKWAICSVVARIPLYAMILRADPAAMPAIIQPTRMPRNPDYTAPPKVPVGSPLPDLGNTRFGMTMGGDMALSTMDRASIAVGARPLRDAIGTGGEPIEQDAVQSCLSLLGGAATMTRDVKQGSISGRGIYQVAAEYAMRDRSLPMAFALFDQGRYAEALPYFKDAARNLTVINGGDEASLFYAKLLLAGFGNGNETKRAIEHLKRAALTNYVERLHRPFFDPANPELNTASGEAALMLGAIYRYGLYGIGVDMDAACRWYRRSAFVGHIAAYKTLGDIQYFGLGVPRDPKMAFANYARAAKRHLASAQAALGNMLEDGDDGIPADLPRAIAWYREALKHDDPDAAYALGVAHERGEGVTLDREVAFGLYRKAALKGSADARLAIGNFYRTGTFVPRDEATARRWFELAARDGSPDGMFNYATFLANGRGGDRDLPRAWAWFRLAADAAVSQDALSAIASVEAHMNAADKATAAELRRTLRCALRTGPSTMTGRTGEETGDACQKARARGDHREAA